MRGLPEAAKGAEKWVMSCLNGGGAVSVCMCAQCVYVLFVCYVLLC